MSVSIEELTGEGDAAPGCSGGMGVANMLVLFLMFLFVTSDLFEDKVLSNFSGTTEARKVTQYGTAVQGIFLVLGFIVLTHVIDSF